MAKFTSETCSFRLAPSVILVLIILIYGCFLSRRKREKMAVLSVQTNVKGKGPCSKPPSIAFK